jgi:hypothetical protein
VQNRRNTNVAIMNAPPRFDLDESSCVNEEVKVFNRKLKKLMKVHHLTKVTDMGLNREHYTRHGLHMNRIGKEWLTSRTADTIKKLFASQKLHPISLEWKENLVESSQRDNSGHNGRYVNLGQQDIRTSRQTQKQPGKMDNFLWSTR